MVCYIIYICIYINGVYVSCGDYMTFMCWAILTTQRVRSALHISRYHQNICDVFLVQLLTPFLSKSHQYSCVEFQ